MIQPCIACINSFCSLVLTKSKPPRSSLEPINTSTIGLYVQPGLDHKGALSHARLATKGKVQALETMNMPLSSFMCVKKWSTLRETPFSIDIAKEGRGFCSKGRKISERYLNHNGERKNNLNLSYWRMIYIAAKTFYSVLESLNRCVGKRVYRRSCPGRRRQQRAKVGTSDLNDNEMVTRRTRPGRTGFTTLVTIHKMTIFSALFPLLIISSPNASGGTASTG
jgi:hypothetical protein